MMSSQMPQSTGESENVIRRLYEITYSHDKGFEHQIQALLALGKERFNLDIAILSNIDGHDYTVQYCACPTDVALTAGDKFTLGATYCDVTSQTTEPVAVENCGQSLLFAQHPAYRAFALESYIGIALRVNGKLYGTLNFSSAKPYPRVFHKIDIDALQLMAAWIEVELHRRQQEQEMQRLNLLLKKQALTDSLTGLPNRRALYEHLRKEFNRLIRNNSRGALMIADIDHFKQFNDTFGHQQGDVALRSVAEALQRVVRDYDFIARFGGEEFVIWLPETEDAQTCQACERLLDSVTDVTIQGEKLTISAGICHFDAAEVKQVELNEQNINTLIDRVIVQADALMYKSKSQGRNRFSVSQFDGTNASCDITGCNIRQTA